MSIESKRKIVESYPKLSNLYEITQFYLDYNAHMFVLLIISKLYYKNNDVVLHLHIENVPCIKPMGICENCPLFQYSGWGKHSGEIAPRLRFFSHFGAAWLKYAKFLPIGFHPVH